MLRRLCLCVGAGSLLLVSTRTLAQTRDEGPEPAGYRAAIEAAVQEHELNHFAEARENFARAHALYPNARTLRGLGVADFELRHYVDSVKELDAALTAPTKRLEGGLRNDTARLLARARTYVGEARLVLDPPDAGISVDGVAVTLGPDARVMLEVGDHELVCSAPGRITQRSPLRVQGQNSTQLRIALARSGGIADPASRADATPERRPRRVLTWIFGGFTLAVSGAALGTAFAVKNTEASFRSCVAAQGACEHLADKGSRLERTRNAMIGLASAAAVATLVSFFVEGRAKRSARVSLAVSPGTARLTAAF